MSGLTATSSTEELHTWLRSRIALYLEVEPEKVDPETSFEAQGLDSMSALTLCDEIEEQFDITVEPTLAWDYPNITKLAEYLRETIEQDAE